MMNSSGTPSTGALSNCRGGKSLETLQNEEAIISASFGVEDVISHIFRADLQNLLTLLR